MNVIDAYKTGKPFRRKNNPPSGEYYRGICFKHFNIGLHFGELDLYNSYWLNEENFLADDWEIKQEIKEEEK